MALGKQGRLVIPADLRTALGLKPGDHLHARLDGNQIVLGRPENAVAALRRLGDSVPRTRSWSTNCLPSVGRRRPMNDAAVATPQLIDQFDIGKGPRLNDTP